MMRTIGFNTFAFVTITNAAANRARVNRQITCSLLQIRLRTLVRSEHIHLIHICLAQVELKNITLIRENSFWKTFISNYYVITRRLSSCEYRLVVGPEKKEQKYVKKRDIED